MAIAIGDILVALVLVMLSGLFSGLTLGLMGLDVNELRITMSSGDPMQAVYAGRILPVRRKGNLLLCTLLLGNVVVNSGLSILLTDISSGLIGLLLSTALIVLFGEIIPQATCSRHALSIGSKLIPVVWVLIFIFFIFAWPISKVLDYVLGQELGTVYDKKGLQMLVELHQADEMADLEHDEGMIMKGALNYSHATVADVMTPLNKVFALDISTKLSFATLTEIFKSGFSRIPCFDRKLDRGDRVVGVLLVRDLILVDPEDEMDVATILNVYGRVVTHVFPDTELGDLLSEFKEGAAHLAIVRDVIDDGEQDPYYAVTGIITMEDIIEVILQTEIVDETDVLVNVKEDAAVVRMQKFDFSRLNIFNSNSIAALTAEKLSQEEGLAVFHHLSGTQPDFSYPAPLSEESLTHLISSAQIAVCCRDPAPAKASQFHGIPTKSVDAEEDVMRNLDVSKGGYGLYRRNQESDFVTLVLEGRVQILAGAQEFPSIVGCWSLIGSLDHRVPDFTAYALTSCRVLRMSITTYHQLAVGFRSRDLSFDRKESSGAENSMMSSRGVGLPQAFTKLQ